MFDPQPRGIDNNAQPMAKTRWIADLLVNWQNTVGGIDVGRCVYHSSTPLGKPSAYGQDIPWLARSLYRTYDRVLDQRYKEAADRYSVYFVATMHSAAPTFALGDALDPCLSEYRRHNPHDDSLDEKARTIRDWILTNRSVEANYFDVGYPWRDDVGRYIEGSDAAFSNDLSDVGRGLVWYATFYKDAETLKHAERLAAYFTRENTPGRIDGVWRTDLGTWLIGPHPAKGFENVDRYANEIGWGWTNYYAAHYLLRLYDAVQDEDLRSRIRECCVAAVQWVFEECQFEDGAVGMSGRDDKWVGMTGLAVLLYVEVAQKAWLPKDIDRRDAPRARRAFQWLVANTGPDRWPTDGYVAVTGQTIPVPAWNTSWMLGITLEALLAGGDIPSDADLSSQNSG